MRKIRLPKSEEEKIADKISDLVTDLRIDLEQVGTYLGRTQPRTIVRRIRIVTEAMEEEINVGSE